MAAALAAAAQATAAEAPVYMIILCLMEYSSIYYSTRAYISRKDLVAYSIQPGRGGSFGDGGMMNLLLLFIIINILRYIYIYTYIYIYIYMYISYYIHIISYYMPSRSEAPVLIRYLTLLV